MENIPSETQRWKMTFLSLHTLEGQPLKTTELCPQDPAQLCSLLQVT